jgi:uncharacterized MAPEG superfamily protein
MQDWLVPYSPTIWAFFATGGLLLVQIVVVDVAGIRARHAPGTPVAADPRSFLFRAVRAHGNTNESVAVFILLALFGVLAMVSPTPLNVLSWTYVAARVAHMAFYYAGIAPLRSASFAISLLALLGMFVLGLSGSAGFAS